MRSNFGMRAGHYLTAKNLKPSWERIEEIVYSGYVRYNSEMELATRQNGWSQAVGEDGDRIEDFLED